MKLNLRNWIGLGMVLISLGLLYPGLTLPFLNIDISISMPLFGKSSLLDETQSVVSSIQTLAEGDNLLVAFLILLFSVIVPVLKAGSLLAILLVRGMGRNADRIQAFVGLISKWSMADVFAVSILIAFLSISGNEKVDASLHEGFYFFLCYCLISIASVQVIDLKSLRAAKIEASLD